MTFFKPGMLITTAGRDGTASPLLLQDIDHIAGGGARLVRKDELLLVLATRPLNRMFPDRDRQWLLVLSVADIGWVHSDWCREVKR